METQALKYRKFRKFYNLYMTRIFNFNAGPAVLPVPVLERIQQELLEYPGAGLSVLEMSHRSKEFLAIAQGAENGLRSLLQIPDNYHVLFLQGGASLQFSMVPLNLLGQGESADYIVTGAWAKKALKEAKKVGSVKVAASTEDGNFTRIPRQDELQLDPGARYVHFTTNNTIFGTQWPVEPETGAVPLVGDASSDILSRPMAIEKYGAIYAGAQKNIGPSGVTVVILRDDMVRDVPTDLPTMLDYRTHIKDKSLYNTPNTFGIYVIGLVCEWLQSLGGLTQMKCLNREKAEVIYEAIDISDFYRGHAEVGSRSDMNITFRLPNEELETRFDAEASAAGMVGLKGHRDVGGLRASVYNAFPIEGARAMAEFMCDFERRNG